MRRLSRVFAASHCVTGAYRGGPQKAARRKEDTEDKKGKGVTGGTGGTGGTEGTGGTGVTEGIGGITVTAVMAATVGTVGIMPLLLPAGDLPRSPPVHCRLRCRRRRHCPREARARGVRRGVIRYIFSVAKHVH